MSQRLVNDLEIKEALQMEINPEYQTTINQMCDGVIYQMRG